MSAIVEGLVLRALRRLPPESAHRLSIRALRSGYLPERVPSGDPRLKVILAGLALPNPLGMAAGYDKDAEVPDALLDLGFGFAEVGTLTPLPQEGNQRPRIFRLREDRAVINRLGFNNRGHAAALQRLLARRERGGVVGVNIGANKNSEDRMADYEAGVRRFAEIASYLAVNISSPNTPGLRALQDRASLAELLRRVLEARAGTGHRTPVFLKIAPDLTEAALDDVAAEVTASGIDGLIVSNTTLARPGLSSHAHTGEAGGLSGPPLFERSTAVLARMRRRLGPDFPIIGVGGVDSAAAALEKIRAGADAVQLYTGLIYEGPGLPATILAGMVAELEREKVAAIAALRDTRLEEWAGKPLT